MAVGLSKGGLDVVEVGHGVVREEWQGLVDQATRLPGGRWRGSGKEEGGEGRIWSWEEVGGVGRWEEVGSGKEEGGFSGLDGVLAE